MSEKDINQKVADEICHAHRLNGRQFKLGEWVALLDGKVVAVASDLDAVFHALRTLDANPHRGMILQVGTSTDVIR